MYWMGLRLYTVWIRNWISSSICFCSTFLNSTWVLFQCFTNDVYREVVVLVCCCSAVSFRLYDFHLGLWTQRYESSGFIIQLIREEGQPVNQHFVFAESPSVGLNENRGDELISDYWLEAIRAYRRKKCYLCRPMFDTVWRLFLSKSLCM